MLSVHVRHTVSIANHNLSYQQYLYGNLDRRLDLITSVTRRFQTAFQPLSACIYFFDQHFLVSSDDIITLTPNYFPNSIMPDSVAVIGCGPGGLFFCHALETKRRQMVARGESVENLPQVTAFERASSPGGVWRSERSFTSSSSIAEEKKDSGLIEATNNTQMVIFGRWKHEYRENLCHCFEIVSHSHNLLSFLLLV